jgi:hypothetical protein
MPCIVRKLTDEQAITQMVEDNTNQREKILPSERAKALKMQQEAIKRQGARDGGTRSNSVPHGRGRHNQYERIYAEDGSQRSHFACRLIPCAGVGFSATAVCK